MSYTPFDQGVYTSTLPTLTNGEVSAVQLDASGRQIVVVQGTPAVSISGTVPVSIASMPSTPVTGTFWQTTQPVSGTVSVNALPTGSNTIGAVTISGTPAVTLASTTITGSVAVTGTFWQATQPVSGTVAVTQSTSPWVTSDSNAIAQGSSTSGEKGFLELGAVTTASPSYTTGQTSPLSLNTSGGLRVDGSAVTQPVSIASSVAVTGTFWQTTQPVSGTVSVNALPTGSNTIGAVTISGTPAVTLASTTITGTVTVSDSNFAAQGSTTSGEKGLLIQGAVTTSSPSYTTGQTSPLSLDASGNLRVNVVTGGGGGGSNAAASATGSGVPADADYVGFNSGGNLVGVSSSNPLPTSDGNAIAQGSSTSGEKGFLELAAVTTASPSYTTGQSSPLSLTTSGGLRVDGSAVTQPVSLASSVAVTGTFWQTTQPVSGTVSINAIPAGSNTIGAVTISGTPAVSLASTTITGTVAVTQSTSPWVTNDANAIAQGSTTSGEKGFLELGAVSTSSPSYTNAQSSPLSLTTAGALRVDASATTQPVSIASMPTTPVTGTFWQTTQPVSGTVSINAIPAGSNSIGTVVLGAGSASVGTVSIASSQTIAVTQATASNLNATVSGTGTVGSAVPSTSAYQGVIATTAYPTAATAGNLTGVMGDKAGRPAVVLNTVRNLVGTSTGNIASTTPASFISAGGSGVFNDIISLVLTNSSSTATIVTITDNGTGGNSYSFALAANGGIVLNFPTPLPQGTANAAWEISCTPAETVYYVAIYAENK